MLTEIPVSRPHTPLLDAVDGGRSIHDLTVAELEQLTGELSLIAFFV